MHPTEEKIKILYMFLKFLAKNFETLSHMLKVFELHMKTTTSQSTSVT
jgi:hypothetical protein